MAENSQGPGRWMLMLKTAVLRDRWILIALSVLVFLVHLHLFTGPTTLDYYPGVISHPTAALAGEILECPAHRDVLEESPPEGLERLGGFAEPYFLDQRLGQPVLLMPFYALFGNAGFRIAFALWRTVMFLTAFLLALGLSQSRIGAYVASLALVFNPFVMGITVLNPNIESSVLVGLGLLAASRVSSRLSYAALSGFLAGLLFGVAHMLMAALALPGIVLSIVLHAGKGVKRKGQALALLGAGLTLPLVSFVILYSSLPSGQPATLHVCVGDSVLIDGTRGWKNRPFLQDQQKQSFDPCKEEAGGWHIHRLGPLTVSIWGMLNWPLHTHLVRSGGVPFPFMIYIPFVLLTTFGLLYFSACLLGIGLALRTPRQRPPAAGLITTLIMVGTFLAIQENIGGFKFSFVLWLFLPIAVFGASAVEFLTRRFRWQAWVPYGVIFALLVAASAWGQQASFPLDQRWVKQFEWKGIAQHIAQGEALQAENKQKGLTRMNLWPAPAPSFGAVNAKLAVDKSTVWLDELQGRVHISDSRSWLAAQALQGIPEGEMVVMNPYMEAAIPTLSDNRWCVVKAPALKPGYRSVFENFIDRMKTSPDADWTQFYLVDSMAFPVKGYLVDWEVVESIRQVDFNGYAIVYRVTRLPPGRHD